MTYGLWPATVWRRCSASALLQAQVAVFRGAAEGPRGARVLSARCPRLPLGVSSIGAGGWVERTFRPRGRRRSAGCLLRPHEWSVHGGCGGPVLDVEVAHLGLVVEVVVRHLRVVGRRPDHDEPERVTGGRRGRAAVDVMRHRDPDGHVAMTTTTQQPGVPFHVATGVLFQVAISIVDVRRVDLDGGQVVEGDRRFARPSLGLEDDSVGGCRVGCLSGCARNLTSAGRDRRRPREAGRPAGRRRERRCQPRGVRASRRRRPPQR